MALIPKPEGAGCTSLQEAVRYVTHSSTPFFWRCMHDTNAFVHGNPDSKKWLVTATNSQPYANELAAFCDQPVMGLNGIRKVTVGITFEQRRVDLTNPPQWPAATVWLDDANNK